MENTLFRINALVDKTFDNMDKTYKDENEIEQCNKEIKKWMKFWLSFRVSQQLPPGCIELKPFLRKQTADLMYTPNQDFIAFIETGS